MKKILLMLLAILSPFSCLKAAVLEKSIATSVGVWFYDPATGLGKTGLTVTSIGCETMKSDGTAAFFNPTASGGSNDMVEKAHGLYFLELTATQLNTVGWFEIGCEISGSTSPPTVFDILSTTAYSSSPTGNIASINDFWTNLLAGGGFGTTSSIGKLLRDNIDTLISTGHSAAALAEPTGVPSATPTTDDALMALYMLLRNKLVVTDTEKKIHNDAGTVIMKKTLSSSGGIFTESQAVNGP